MENIFECRNLRVCFYERPIVNDVSFDLKRNSILSIVGASGTGKSTLLRTFNRLIEEEVGFQIDGQILFEGKSIYEREANKYDLRKKVGMLFQKPTIFPTSIFNNVIFGLRQSFLHRKSRYLDIAEKSLREASLWDEVKDRLDSKAHMLSIGQQQRLGLARILAINPDIILLDEPTSSLDPKAAQNIETLMLDLKKLRSIILVTHDPDQAVRLSDEILMLKASESGSYAKVLKDSSAFGQEITQLYH